MSNKKTSFLWISILALACMFFAGQAWAQCTDPEPPDVDNDGVANADDNCVYVSNATQDDGDGDGAGDACDICPADDTDVCDSGLIVSSGCDTYIGYNPITGDAHVCCSGGATPECLATETPDIPCEVSYEFCANGSVTKTWDPDPTPGTSIPGHATETGTWGYDLATNNLLIETGIILPFPMTTVESHQIAITYMDGGVRKLDWDGTIQLDGGAPGDGTSLVGSSLMYYGSDVAAIAVTGLFSMDVDISRTNTLTDNFDGTVDWNQVETNTSTCTGAAAFCPAGNDPIVVNIPTSGTISDDPAQLKNIADLFYFLVVDDSLAMEKQ